MMKRVIPLLMLSIVLAMTPSAMAQCFKCKPINRTCPAVTSGGFDFCYFIGPDCIIGYFCGVAATQPLASEYQVASVERADEPQPNPNETRIASLEPKAEPAPAPAAQR